MSQDEPDAPPRARPRTRGLRAVAVGVVAAGVVAAGLGAALLGSTGVAGRAGPDPDAAPPAVVGTDDDHDDHDEPHEAPVRTDPGPPAGWRLDLDEDFDTLDPATWTVRGPESYERESSRVLAENTTVAGGRLRMRATDVPTDGRLWTGADMETYDTYSLPGTFRVEVRAKVPFQPGLWPCPLWLRPADLGDGEIDVAEMFGSEIDEPAIHQTVHSEYGPTHEQRKSVTPYADLGLDPLGWHTYSMLKAPGSITMWTDGVQTARFTRADTPFFDRIFSRQDRWALRISLQVGGAGGRPGADNDWSAAATTLVVDHVRAWIPPVR